MFQYNTQPDSAAGNPGWEAFTPELAPFHPTIGQSGGWNRPAAPAAGTGQPLGHTPALPPSVEPRYLHANAGSRAASNKAIFQRHVRAGSGSTHTCHTCSTSFSNNYQLEQHAAKNKHKAFICACGKTFTKLSTLRRHIEESTQAREHACPVCGNEFKRPGHVEQHLRLIHNKAKDAIKDPLSAQKSQPHQEPGQASAAIAMAPTGPMNAQVNQPVVIPGGPWTGPTGFSAAVPAEHPGSRPGDFSDFFSRPPTSGVGLMPEIPAFTPQSFVPQATDPAYPAHQTTAAANHTGFPANTAPDFVGYPAAYPAGDLGLFNVDPATMPQNSVDAFGLPVLENVFMGESFDFNFDLNFGNP